MSPILKRIKRCIIDRRVRFTFKAESEMLRDGLGRREVLESILNANDIDKVIRSRAIAKGTKREHLYVIQGLSYDMNLIYTKGKLAREHGEELFYILISSKLASEG